MVKRVQLSARRTPRSFMCTSHVQEVLSHTVSLTGCAASGVGASEFWKDVGDCESENIMNLRKIGY